MITDNKLVVIEIPEEAYKQNAIYRPWPEIKAAETTGCPDTLHSQTRERPGGGADSRLGTSPVIVRHSRNTPSAPRANA